MRYIELHACSAFSFLRGGSFPEHIAETAAELAMPAVALLDRNGVYGVQRFSVAAREHGVRPIIGCELVMAHGALLPVLVQNRTGYTNLCQLLTQAHLRSEKGNCTVEWSELPEFAEGLVALFESGSTPVPGVGVGVSPKQSFQSPRKRDASANARDGRAPRNAADIAQFLINVFGRENVFVELQRHFIRGEDETNKQLIDLAASFRLPILATNGVITPNHTGAKLPTSLPASANTLISMPLANCLLKMLSDI
jgi:error-prone DNA polymerase